MTTRVTAALFSRVIRETARILHVYGNTASLRLFFHKADLVFVSYILCETKANELLKLWGERKQHKTAFRFHR